MAIKRTADVVIIGAGVMGCSLAFHLTRAGMKDVMILEKKHVAAGGTGKSGALVRMHYTNEPEARMAFASLTYFQNWKDIVGGECGFTKTGFIMTVTPENAEKLRKNVEMLKGIGIKTEVITAQDLRELQPFCHVDDLTLAAYEPESGYADPKATTYAFLHKAQEMGATLHEGVAVTKIRVEGHRVVGVETTDGSIDSPRVVLMAGPWSGRLAKTSGVEISIQPRRAQIAFFKRAPELARGHFVFIDGAQGSYFRPHGGELTLAGVGVWEKAPILDPDHYDEKNDPDFIEAAKRKLSARLPPMAQSAYERGHAGLYDISEDTRAILDRAPGVDGLYLATGFSGTGFKKSPAVGACISELILEGKAKTVDIHPFRFSRFAENDPIQGKYEYRLPADFGHKI
ncbi:MAG: FAD-binding oxidoreductase [Candidatus Tectomicrobia bacterium]|nr:FAD-binding oxidoreductase [Candidatus Tectomicrobia bacterium]